jgi:hypothetical protein
MGGILMGRRRGRERDIDIYLPLTFDFIDAWLIVKCCSQFSCALGWRRDVVMLSGVWASAVAEIHIMRCSPGQVGIGSRRLEILNTQSEMPSNT